VKTGIQYSQLVIDSRFRGNDGKRAFFKALRETGETIVSSFKFQVSGFKFQVEKHECGRQNTGSQRVASNSPI